MANAQNNRSCTAVGLRLNSFSAACTSSKRRDLLLKRQRHSSTEKKLWRGLSMMLRHRLRLMSGRMMRRNRTALRSEEVAREDAARCLQIPQFSLASQRHSLTRCAGRCSFFNASNDWNVGFNAWLNSIDIYSGFTCTTVIISWKSAYHIPHYQCRRRHINVRQPQKKAWKQVSAWIVFRNRL